MTAGSFFPIFSSWPPHKKFLDLPLVGVGGSQQLFSLKPTTVLVVGQPLHSFCKISTSFFSILFIPSYTICNIQYAICNIQYNICNSIYNHVRYNWCMSKWYFLLYDTKTHFITNPIGPLLGSDKSQLIPNPSSGWAWHSSAPACYWFIDEFLLFTSVLIRASLCCSPNWVFSWSWQSSDSRFSLRQMTWESCSVWPE